MSRAQTQRLETGRSGLATSGVATQGLSIKCAGLRRVGSTRTGTDTQLSNFSVKLTNYYYEINTNVLTGGSSLGRRRDEAYAAADVLAFGLGIINPASKGLKFQTCFGLAIFSGPA